MVEYRYNILQAIVKYLTFKLHKNTLNFWEVFYSIDMNSLASISQFAQEHFWVKGFEEFVCNFLSNT